MHDSAKSNRDTSLLILEDKRFSGTVNARLDHLVDINNTDKPVTNKRDIYACILHYIPDHPDRIFGDFAGVAYDRIEDTLHLIRDQLGTRPLYYTDQHDYLAFATEMKALKSLPGFNVEMDETWIADSISTVQSEKWRTPYLGIERLLPGHRMVIRHSKSVEKYWDLDYRPPEATLAFEDAVELFRQQLHSAVEKRMSGDTTIAAELSGGLDSSGVTAMAAKMMQDGKGMILPLTHAFSDDSLGKFFPYEDEREFSMEVCSYLGIDNQVFCDADGYGLIDMLRRDIFRQSGPTQQGYSMLSDTLYDRGKAFGVTKILSGFGGDEGVTSKAAGFFEELAKNGRWDLYKKEFLTKAGKTGGKDVKRFIRYYLKRYFPFADRWIMDFRRGIDWREEKYPGLGFTSAFESRMGIEERFYERLGFPDDPDVRARQYKRIMHDHVSQRFEYSYIDAKAYGIEYAYPLWDIDLLEFYYSLPTEYKFRNGMGRAIYRDAMKGLLPERVRLRNDKTGATVPTVQQRFMKDYDAITELIKRSRENNNYHYLDYDKMLAWQIRMRDRGFKDKIPANPAAFFNSLQVLLLQEMERNGEFKSGIRW
jgi:asparagine synthase (glutamine-hydrolysing)